ncbi:MAG: glycosyltransferase family 2 protein [Planctomycetota bacterium]|jgi:GT2 family glycosyltransferase
MKLGVVIVNYRQPQRTIECLHSLGPELAPRADGRVVVVDNASGDDSADRIGAWIERHGAAWATLVRSDVNGGFSAGNNLGMAHVDAEHYLLLNNDTLVRPGAVDRLVATLEADPGTGLVGPRLTAVDGTPQVSCFRDRTPLTELVWAAGTGPVSRLFPRSVVAMPTADEPAAPDWLSFACVLVRRAVLDQVGPLDDGYFMYFEDIDFCRRAREAGWRLRHEPRAEVVHLHGTSSPVESSRTERDRLPRYFYESRSRYYAKFHGGRLGVLRANLLWSAGRLVALAREVVGQKRPHACRGEARDNWTNWRRPLRAPSLTSEARP